MSDRQVDSAETNDLLTIPNPSNNQQSKTSSNEVGCHYFHVRCLSNKEILKGKKYESVDDIKKDAFALYPDGTFNDDNAILTYLDTGKVEVLLTSVPNLPQKRHSKHLFIRFVCICFLNVMEQRYY
jgi:hypothetical protein